MLGMKNHFAISGSIEIRDVDIAGMACICKFLAEIFNMDIQTSYSSTEILIIPISKQIHRNTDYSNNQTDPPKY